MPATRQGPLPGARPTTESGRALRVAIVSELRVLREMIQGLLAREKGMHVVASVASPCDAAIRRLDLDVVMVDATTVSPYDLPDEPLGTPVAVFGLRVADHPVIIRWTAAGASACVPADATPQELLSAVRAVARGELAFPPAVVEVVIRATPRLADRAAFDAARQGSVDLTPREREILMLIRAELSNKEIARRLGIELSTVKNHVHSILKRMRAPGRREAARARLDG